MSPRRPTRRRNERGRGGGAVPADDLAVAVLSGRRVLLFQRHRMGGGGRRHHGCRLAARLAGRDARRWLRLLRRACFWRRRIAPHRRGTSAALREIAELAAAFVPSRERQLETSTQGRAFIEIARAAWTLRRARRAGRRLRWRDRLSRRGRDRQRGARHSAGAGDARLPACGGVELDFRRRAAGAARPDRQPARAGAASKPMSPPPRSARLQPRSTISAARPFAPISPACATRRNIRGCSGHDGDTLASSPRTRGPITTGLGCYGRRGRAVCLIDRSRGMGPGVRRDDDR